MSTDLRHSDHFYQILDLLREHMKISKFVGKAYGTALTASESMILVELDVDQTRSASFLARLLNLEKSVVSRSIQRLVESRYLSATRSSEDARRKVLRITKKGQEFLALHDQMNAAQLAELTANLNVAELSELQGFLKTLADGMGADPVVLRPRESPLLIEMRRISRAFSIFGGSLAHSGYSPLEFHLFAEIEYAEEPIRPGDVCRAFAITLNTMSRVLARLDQRGLITRRKDPDDQRNLILGITPAGRKALEHILKCCHALLEPALENLPPAELQRFIAVFAKYLGVGRQGRVPLLPGVYVERLTSEAQLQEARSFLILQLVRLNAFLHVSKTIFGEENLCFALKAGEQVGAVLELAPRGNGAFVALNFATAPEFDRSELTALFIRKVLDIGAWRQRKFEAAVPESSLLRGWLNRLKDVPVRDEAREKILTVAAAS